MGLKNIRHSTLRVADIGTGRLSYEGRKSFLLALVFNSELLKAFGDTRGVSYLRRARNMTAARLFHVRPSVS